jgi:aminoglycoside 3-N-acetyltransferase
MRSYSVEELTSSLRDIGLSQGDTIYLSTQLYGLGPLEGAKTKTAMVESVYQGIHDVIGETGTIVVPTFTQQVGRFGLPYIHETTESMTGIFGEYIRSLPESKRSIHPIFSVAAMGARKTELTADISPVAFGRDSAFERLYRTGGKAVCMGFPYYSGHITSLMHFVETSFAVPYYYNKIVNSEVYVGGERIHRPFIINVKYLNADCAFDYKKYINALSDAGEISSAKLGSGMIYSVDIKKQIDMGYRLLKEDIYSFLKHPPRFVAGMPPVDGPPGGYQAPQKKVNWTGFLIGV